MKTDELVKKAVKYIRKYKDWSEADESAALDKMATYRCDIDFANHSIAENIQEILEEFQIENNLADDWWSQQGSIDDWFMIL